MEILCWDMLLHDDVVNKSFLHERSVRKRHRAQVSDFDRQKKRKGHDARPSTDLECTRHVTQKTVMSSLI